ncbi:MAG: poly-gamma-glutamate biosynthesis protein PgsC [Leptospiraceae bacterium]|nr:poly-gamma-glutamate biosynthesis protein PgsC [Leptospiraceae bacterium]MCZ8347064.1 poly-gamma-glutamate biosynthesis protein PgsC [Leptospiraceae bacterium]
MNTIILSIGLGLFVSLLFVEFFGLIAGGMIVPGYFAIHLHKPGDLAVTVFVSLLTYFLIRLLSYFIILYGRRRSVLTILISFVLGVFINHLTINLDELEVIGYIIPGLIAIWYDRQGIIETLATLCIISIVVRLLLILILGEDINLT